MVTTSVEHPPINARSERASLRQDVIDILQQIQVPAPRHLIQDLLEARGNRVNLAQLPPPLRAGQASESLALVPAIWCLDLSAIPGTYTCSTWSLEQRLVGMYTPRVRHLRVLLRLLDDAGLQGSEAGQRLINRLAETVPGAILRGRVRVPLEVRASAEAELAEIEPLDLTERGAAATRLTALAPAFQLWGQPTLLRSDGAQQP
jgi:hypothetical protein